MDDHPSRKLYLSEYVDRETVLSKQCVLTGERMYAAIA